LVEVPVSAPSIQATRRLHVVVGGGVAGLAAARELALRGERVLVVERSREGDEALDGSATRGSVGVLSVPSPGRSALARMQLLAYREYGAWAEALADETGIAIGLSRPGSIRLQAALPREGSLRKLERAFAEARIEGRWLSPEELRERVPGLDAYFGVGLFLPDECVIRPIELARALRASLRRLGVDFLEGAGDARLVDREDPKLEVPALRTIGNAVFIVAAGAWSTAVVAALDPSRGGPDPPLLPLKPIRGQALEVRSSSDTGPNLRFEPPGMEREYHVIPKGQGLAWIGSTVEDAGFLPAVTEEGIAELLRAGRAVLPSLGESALARAWAGLRPQALERGGPFVGPLPGARDVWVHAGHYRSGILLSPFTARLLVRGLMASIPDEGLASAGFDGEGRFAFRVGRE